MVSLGASTWPDVAARARTFVAVPLGSTEQHGPHLPLDTDTTIAVALANALADQRPDVLVAPPIAISASGEHAGFAGTLSIGSEVLAQVIVEVARSADWARGILLVNGHGGNGSAIASALTTLRFEQRNVLAWWPESPPDERSDAHAGWLETSVMLHLAPASVRGELAMPGDVRPLPGIMQDLRQQGVHGLSPNGVLGDPTGAVAECGASIFTAWVADLLARFDSWAQ